MYIFSLHLFATGKHSGNNIHFDCKWIKIFGTLWVFCNSSSPWVYAWQMYAFMLAVSTNIRTKQTSKQQQSHGEYWIRIWVGITTTVDCSLFQVNCDFWKQMIFIALKPWNRNLSLESCEQCTSVPLLGLYSLISSIALDSIQRYKFCKLMSNCLTLWNEYTIYISMKSFNCLLKCLMVFPRQRILCIQSDANTANV